MAVGSVPPDLGHDFDRAHGLRAHLGCRVADVSFSDSRTMEMARDSLPIIYGKASDRLEIAIDAPGPGGPARCAALHDLAAWLERLLGTEDQDGRRHSPRFRDLHQRALPALLPPTHGRAHLNQGGTTRRMGSRRRAAPVVRCIPPGGRHRTPARSRSDPAAPAVRWDNAGEDTVQEGVGAARVCQDLIFAYYPAPEEQASRRQLLLQYCQLDIIAMLMIWRHCLGQASPTGCAWRPFF